MKKNEIYWVTLDPVVGSEEGKRGPCVIVSPNILNDYLSTFIIVPITSQIKDYLFRVRCDIDGREGEIMCEQIRTVSIKRFGPAPIKLGELSEDESAQLNQMLHKMFCES